MLKVTHEARPEPPRSAPGPAERPLPSVSGPIEHRFPADPGESPRTRPLDQLLGRAFEWLGILLALALLALFLVVVRSLVAHS